MLNHAVTATSDDRRLTPDARDPYAFYEHLRAVDPVHWDEQGGCWVLTRHADVIAALQDERLSAVRAAWQIPDDFRDTLGPAIRAVGRQMLFLDPPDHTRLRRLVNTAFTSRVVEMIRPRIAEVIDELLAPVERRGRMDAIADFALPLPAIVIAELLGVPAQDRPRFLAWSDDFGALLDGASYEAMIRGLQGVTAFIEYFRTLIARRRQTPGDGLLHGLITAREQGDVLSEEELLGNCLLLLAAGHGTTTHVIGNGLLALLENPEQVQRLRDDPSLGSSAVHELLRYDAPVQMTGRVAAAGIEIGGKLILEGRRVVLCLAAANRDPARFRDPGRLDIGRTDHRHLAFGHGIHFCVGAPLARIEAEMAFAALLRRFPVLRLETEILQWQPSTVFRGLRSLPVSCG